MTKLKAFVFLAINGCNLQLSAQKHTDNYQIVLSTSNSITNVYVEKQIQSPTQTDLAKYYFWYRFDSIHHTQGSWAGKRLHGQYERFSNEKKLVETGNFHFGLKNGEWIAWHSNGAIKTITHWKKGKPYGQEQHFNEAGELTQTVIFRSGKARKTRIAKKFRPKSTPSIKNQPKTDLKKDKPKTEPVPPKTPKRSKKTDKPTQKPTDKKPSEPKPKPSQPNRG